LKSEREVTSLSGADKREVVRVQGEVKKPVKCLLYFTWSYCKQLASNVKLVTGKYKIISRQLGSFEVLFSRPAEVSVAMMLHAIIFCSLH
jgi:hypothetical protein